MANQTYTKNKLSASTNGKGILVVATASTGTTIHTAVSGTTSFDEIWIYAYNGHTATVILTLEWGETTVPNGNCILTLPFQSGRTLVVDGRLLNNSLLVTAFASVANVIVIDGFINAIV